MGRANTGASVFSCDLADITVKQCCHTMIALRILIFPPHRKNLDPERKLFRSASLSQTHTD